MSSKPKPGIWSPDMVQWIPWFDSCQLTVTWIVSNIKRVRCKPRLHDLVLDGVWHHCHLALLSSSLGAHAQDPRCEPCWWCKNSCMVFYFFTCMWLWLWCFAWRPFGLLELQSVHDLCDRKISGSRSFQRVKNVGKVVNIRVTFNNLSMYTTIGLKAELHFNLSSLRCNGIVLMMVMSRGRVNISGKLANSLVSLLKPSKVKL